MFHYGYLLPITFVFGSISWRFLITTVILPIIGHWDMQKLIRPFVAIHLFRYISLCLLVPGLTTAGQILPVSHIHRLAAGDIMSSIIAMCSLTALHLRWNKALYLVVLLSIVGLLDLLLATIFDMPIFGQEIRKIDNRMFAILTTYIPLVFVSHVFIVQLLWKHFRKNKSLKI